MKFTIGKAYLLAALLVLALSMWLGARGTQADWDEVSPPERWRGINMLTGDVYWTDELVFCRLDDIDIYQDEDGRNILSGVRAPMEVIAYAIDTHSNLVMTIYDSPLGFFTVNRTAPDSHIDAYWLEFGECNEG